MMARFWLSIEGDDLWSAMMLLNAAAIPTIGAYYGNQPPPDWKLNRLTAAVDAGSEVVARSRVLNVLPDGYKVDGREDVDPP
jgi:hypothetical protein